jgi:hypothetical protein
MDVAADGGEKQVSVEGFGVGLIPALIKRRAKGKKASGADDIRRGRRALEEILQEIEPLDVEIDIDGKPWKSDLISVDVLNIPFTGPALPLAHAADPSDEPLAVVVLESEQRKAFAQWIQAPQEAEPPVGTRRGKTIHVRWRGADSRVDDELVKSAAKWREVVLTRDPEPLHILRSPKHPAVKDEEGAAEPKGATNDKTNGKAKRARDDTGDRGTKASRKDKAERNGGREDGEEDDEADDDDE